MKRLVFLILLCATCLGQDRPSSAACPIMVAVASTDVRLQNIPNVVIWFENQSQKTLERARLELFMVDSGGTRHAASARYLLISETAPGQTGLAVRPSQQEAEHFGESWRGMRGVEVRVTDAVFTDGTRWEPAPAAACSRTFLNSQYEPNLRQWHRELRARWNRQHPDEPIPDSALQALLQPERDGWR